LLIANLIQPDRKGTPRRNLAAAVDDEAERADVDAMSM
jgi:hypothetical protein